jgi:pentatricopeptide repeat protein
MLAAGITPDHVTYSMLISACGRMDRNQPEQALQFFREMKERKVEADLPVYNSLIDTLGKAGMCDEAAAVLEVRRV